MMLMRMMIFLLVCSFVLVPAPPLSADTGKDAAPLIPMEDFFRNPVKTHFRLSPNGEYLAFWQPWKSRLNVHVQKIGEDKAVRVTSAEKRDILGYMWANDNRLLYAQDTGGDENVRIYAVNIDGSNPKNLTPFDKVKSRLIDELKNDPDHMLISMNRRNRRIFDVYRIDINSGEARMIAENPGNIDHWLTDHAGRLRVAVTTDGVNESLLYRVKESERFKKVLTTNFKQQLHPLFFTFDNKYLYVTSNIGRDTFAIFKYDAAEGKFMETVFEHSEVDVFNLMRSDKRKRILGVEYVLDKRHYHFFDAGREKLQKELEKRLPGVEVVLTGMSRDESRALVRTYSDKTRGAYYFYNLSNGELRKLAEISPWLKAGYMADMKPIEYPARDGLTIQGYLTLPKGSSGKRLPVVIHPHGGPWHRDKWGYDPEVQFLANRGYAVLQMNFRGSTGYGRKFWEQGFKQWGRAMQDDVTDGVQWLIQQGIAHPKRIGIYGASYGGYAALAGLTFTPKLYVCGVDYAGFSNLFSWIKAFPPYWKPYLEMIYEMVGHPLKDRALFEAVSPAFHLDKIKAPLFIAQGVNDVRVPKSDSDELVKELKKRGVPVTYMVKDNEGHGFRNEENRFDFYRTMERFLGRHLRGRVEKTR